MAGVRRSSADIEGFGSGRTPATWSQVLLHRLYSLKDSETTIALSRVITLVPNAPIGAVRAAVLTVVERHESLRTQLLVESGNSVPGS